MFSLLSAKDCRRESGGDSITNLIELAETGHPVCRANIREDEREQRKKALRTRRETHNAEPRISRAECSRCRQTASMEVKRKFAAGCLQLVNVLQLFYDVSSSSGEDESEQ